MKTITKFMVAAIAVAAAGAAAVHTIDAHVISPVAALHRSAAPGSRTYADWQGPLGQSFGARFLAQGAPRDAIAGVRPGTGSRCPSSRAWSTCRSGMPSPKQEARERFAVHCMITFIRRL